jgi:CoA:oxalate CoA-transferase
VNGPLDGIRVLDLTTFLSGPFATQILADLGADVIKVESMEGDSSRAIPPHYVAGESVYYLSTNRGKRSIVLDLKTSRGADLAQRLVLQSDVVFENFRPGVAARLGLDREILRERKESLIWTSITGFGSAGEWSSRPAYDMIVQALSGVMSLTGHEGGPAARLGIPAGDTVAGLFGVIGTLAAVHERRRTGKGAIVDVSMLDSMLSMLSYQAAYASHTGVAPKPQGAAHDSIATYRSFKGRDGREFVVTANTERMWRAMCEQLSLPHLIDDPRFETASSRQENRGELRAILDAAFLSAPSTEWVDRLVAAQVPAAPIKNVPEALEDARSQNRGMLVALSDGETNDGFVGIATPIEVDGARLTSERYPPRLGESSVEVLRDILDLSSTEIHELLRDNVVHQAPSRERDDSPDLC